MTGDEASASRPSAHTQRYDRQLRLWASSGQASLESAKVLVLGASHLGACVLKNLILPGIGAFTLVDANKVSDLDLGNNFFISSTDSKGKSRAEEEVKHLSELNPSVDGRAVQEDPMDYVENHSLDEYALVIAVNQPHCVLYALGERAWDAKEGTGVPVMVVKGAGFVGEVQVQVKEAAIIETHPESIVDLRLTRPWPALKAYADEYNIQSGDSMEHSHIPFVVILLHKLEEWKKAHEGALPVPSTDRKAFTDLINAFRQAENNDEENVDEALGSLGQHVWRPISLGVDGRLPTEVRHLFSEKACDEVNSKSSNFWLLVKALRKFVEKGDGLLPLPGSLPDMKSLSATYVELQRIYRQKAAEDLTVFKQHLAQVLEHVQLPADAISPDEIESFTKHASFLKVIRGRRLEDMAESPNRDILSESLGNASYTTIMPHHLAMFAAEKFYEMHAGRYPGSSVAMTEHIIGGSGIGEEPEYEIEGEPDYEEDVNDLIQIAEDVLVMMSVKSTEDQEIVDACREFTRSGHADLPSTAALLGGIAAQEAIKLVTRQYIPINNTLVYDGVTQTMAVYQL